MTALKRFATALLFGAIGFGFGLLTSFRLQSAARPLWTVTLALSGLAAGTGAGLGDTDGGGFRRGIIGALPGLGLGWILDRFGAGWALAAGAGVAMIAGLALYPRPSTESTAP